MSIYINDKSGATPQQILIAGTSPVDQILNGNSKNAIANKAVYNALQQKVEKTVNDLLYYYSKQDTYNKAEVRQLIGQINTLTIEVVSSLPTTDISTTTIYFVGPATGTNTYDEYIYNNDTWAKIGDTSIDLTQYVTSANLTTILQSYYTKAEVDNLLNGYYTKTEVDTELNAKQDTLTFDSTPTAGSNNPVKSSGIYDTTADIYEVMSRNGAKNYAKNEATNTSQQNITFTVNSDKSINAATTAAVSDTWSYRIGKFPMKAGTYILSDGNTGDYSSTCFLQLVNEAETAAIAENHTNHDASFTLASDQTVILRLFYLKNATFSYTFYPMIRLASDTDSTYQPYAETNYQLTQGKMSYSDNGILGAKNLLIYPYTDTTKTVNGITFTDNADGTITVSGTATANAALTLQMRPVFGNQLPLILSGCPTGGAFDHGYRLQYANYYDMTDIVLDTGEGAVITKQFNYSTYPNARISIEIRNGTVFSTPITFKPMLRLASDPDSTYQPYAMTNRELSEDTAGIKSQMKQTAFLGGEVGRWVTNTLRGTTGSNRVLHFDFNGDGIGMLTWRSNNANSVYLLVNKDGTFSATKIGGTDLTINSNNLSDVTITSGQGGILAAVHCVASTWAYKSNSY